MKIILIGPQGCGKGTQAKILSKKFGLCHISTGNLLRHAKSPLKERIHKIIDKGDLVPNKMILNLLKEKLRSNECSNGYILDGYPRNIKQAKQLAKIDAPDLVLEIKISDKESINRILNRLTCLKCGSVYNLKSNPPKKEMICDKCGNKLSRRADDNKKALKERLKIYHEETEPLLKFYNLKVIDGEQEIKKVTKDIFKNIKKVK